MFDRLERSWLANLIVTGVINKAVVTLSKKQDSAAVKRHKVLTKVQTLPLAI